MTPKPEKMARDHAADSGLDGIEHGTRAVRIALDESHRATAAWRLAFDRLRGATDPSVDVAGTLAAAARKTLRALAAANWATLAVLTVNVRDRDRSHRQAGQNPIDRVPRG